MNVTSRPNALVTFSKPTEYLFSGFSDQNPQGGIINRSFVSIRIDGIDDEKIEKLDKFYHTLAEQNQKGECQFSMLTHVVTNQYRPFFHTSFNGNSAYWTSKGLAEIGLLDKESNWPLWIFFKMLYQWHGRDINVISYRSVQHDIEPSGALVYPFYWLKKSYNDIWNLENFSNIVLNPVIKGDQVEIEIINNKNNRIPTDKLINVLDNLKNKMK